MKFEKWCVALLMLSCVFLTVGCSHLRVRDRWFDSDRVAEVPSEVLPIWTDTVLHQPGKPGVRGFGGRVYFYEEGKPDPVRVDGQLVVYVFEDAAAKSTSATAKPLKKYIITPEQLATHHSESGLGNSTASGSRGIKLVDPVARSVWWRGLMACKAGLSCRNRRRNCFPVWSSRKQKISRAMSNWLVG